MRGIRALLVTLMLAAGLIAFVAGLWSQSGWLMPVYWRNRLASAPEDQVAALLGQIGQWGEGGLPVLVEAMNSPRPRVAKESREVLWDTLMRWDRLPLAESSRRLWMLAESLAEQVDRFGPSAQADAAQLASQILMRPVDETTVPQWHVTEACQRVLTAAEQARVERAKALAATPPGQARDVPGAATPSAEEKGGQAPRPNQPSSVQVAEGQANATSEAIAPASTLNQPSRLFDQPPHAAIVRSDSPAALLPPPAPSPSDAAAPNSRRAQETFGAQGFVREMPKPAEETPQVEPGLLELQEPVGIGVDTVELMRSLRSFDATTVAAARAELGRRGFSEVQLELALRLFDPDPAVRKELVRVLPEMRSLDATPWLLQLCRDQNSDVRRSAFTFMATTTDPRLIERLIQIARQDPDLTIKRQAERLSIRRDEARRPASGRTR